MFDLFERIKFFLFGKKFSSSTETVYSNEAVNTNLHYLKELNRVLFKLKTSGKLLTREVNFLLKYYFNLDSKINVHIYRINTELLKFSNFELIAIDPIYDDHDVLTDLALVVKELTLNIDMRINISAYDFFEVFTPISLEKDKQNADKN
jgi:hypothetical protein